VIFGKAIFGVVIFGEAIFGASVGFLGISLFLCAPQKRKI
jgi:hypothetical protein